MRLLGKSRIPLLFVAFGLLLLVGAGRTSAAKPPLGSGDFSPGPLVPWYPSSATVTTILFIAYALAALGVLAGLARMPLRIAPWWSVGVLGAAVLLTGPFGSADHLNYAAYGRIAMGGDDPYAESPIDWHDGLDPVAGAVQVPWQTTPSIYGPLATALQTFCSAVGGSNLRDTVWVWQFMIVLAWFGVRLLLLRMTATDEIARRRVDVLWTFNPLVFAVLVLGAHVDLIAALFVLGALWTMKDKPWAAGIFSGAAFSTKVTYGVVLLAVLWGWRKVARPELRQSVLHLLGGIALIVVPSYLVAGPNVLRQLRAAGGSFSYASPWSPVIRGLRNFLGEWAVTAISFGLAAVLMVLFAWGGYRLVERFGLARSIEDAATREAIALTFVLMTAYVLLAPYSLPWYDAVTWMLLPLLVPFAWDAVFVVRHLFMTLAYAPGRAAGIAPSVQDWTLGFRSNVTPYVCWAALVALVGLHWRSRRRSSR
ncbi:hypothetical protein [Yimella sp. cx-51]|uniref:hypothetical protein n=1 Tax=Yimella sp. cx-51 TaxID=2770551 RepID=UPI00165D9699|nr:hypothetical protein [Yimella sp. cx-51]MBC9957889.1 hypothetical protein [Yimella sp. cx-51]QTH38024.1 hypothetical protein J5M86_14535 [Yimella sp. cx-51]